MRDALRIVALIPLLAGLVLIAVPDRADAQARGRRRKPASAEQERQAQAEALFERGAEAYQASRYEEAIAIFQQSRALADNPLIDYNIALAWLALGRLDEARLAALDAERQGGLTDPSLTRNRARLGAIDVLLNARLRLDAISLLVPAQTHDLAEQDSDICLAGLCMGGLGWGGVSLLVVGGGLLGAALVTNVEASAQRDDYEAALATGDPDLYKPLRADLLHTQQTGRVYVYLGAGVVALGGALLLIDGLSADSPAPVHGFGGWDGERWWAGAQMGF